MSITTLGLSSQLRVPPTPQVAHLFAAQAVEQAGQPPAAPTQSQTNAQNIAGALNTFTKFIPGDVLTLYLGLQAGIKSAFGPLTTITGRATTAALISFGCCMIFTVFWIIAMRVVSARATQTPFVFPLWPLFAGVLAFSAYAFGSDCILVNTTAADHATTFWAAFFVTVISAVLALLNRVVQVVFPDQAV